MDVPKLVLSAADTVDAFGPANSVTVYLELHMWIYMHVQR